MWGDHMKEQNCDPLALTTAINTLAVAIAGQLNDEDLEMAAVILTQLGIHSLPFPYSAAAAAERKTDPPKLSARVTGGQPLHSAAPFPAGGK